MSEISITTPRIHLLFGEESLLIRELTNRIIESRLTSADREFNLVSLESDPDVPELLHLVESVPFFGEHKVVVIRNTKMFQAPRRRTVSVEPSNEEKGGSAGDMPELEQESLTTADPRLLRLFQNMPAYTTLVFTATKADKRIKLTKAVAEYGAVQELVPFRPTEEREIRTWVEKVAGFYGKKMSRDAMDHLMAVAWTMNQIPRSFLSSEVEKAVHFVGEKPVIDRKALEQVLANIPEVSAFSMTEALARRNVGQALERMEDLFVSKEPPLKIIGLLAYHVRRWLLTRQISDRKGTEAEMRAALGTKGGSAGMGSRVIAQSRHFQTQALTRSLLILADANIAVRSGRDPKPYLEQLVIELCR